MKRTRLLAIALFVVLMSIALVVPLSAAAAPTHTSTSSQIAASSDPFTNIAVSGTVTDHKGNTVGTFNGTLNVTHFAAQSGNLVAMGKLSGTLTDTSGKVIGTITNKGVTMPVPTLDPSCQVLTLVVGPIHLNVLGLVVDVSQITITVTAQPGTLLGGLLCQLAGATTLQQIVSLLNQILALLGGV